mmetsp:Transcript_6830/g.18330  ORF Transcript_6830/g.18330 Transcript_6830/m.18330 type:complete len:223 (-) Transcript_6830:296-964(-)|eukprot:CAMPEP_0202355754 /NCGR_PEP_ID=MMETSP1126-20121109/10511_1 /ASSEMBLY_ACC=CAM_ASM_000457 /TAXON_ID=3047 /ORGANISM="Dunaliella tertiolecta, Strain CCMP1320" /LENGTH=222 /DNA_ID=CAMNT_0048948411 /DNA_START=76 /DNA_END=744 /DNA_ORIENTATION=+
MMLTHTLGSHGLHKHCLLFSPCPNHKSPRRVLSNNVKASHAYGRVSVLSEGSGRGASQLSCSAAAPTVPDVSQKNNMMPSGSKQQGEGASSSDCIGVVIVDHGSRKKDSNDMLVEFVQLYKQTTGSRIVEPAHMEIAEPSIGQAIGECVKAGANKVVVAPYFLSRGRHIQEDIPALVSEAREKYPGIQCVVADPIGIDPLMAQLISNRVKKVVDETQQRTAA